MTDGNSGVIAIDWGTTNRRVYRIADGVGTMLWVDDFGAIAMAGRDWAAEIAAVRGRAGDLPVLIAGMAGSNRGWRDTNYVPCPASLDALAAGAIDMGDRIYILPGVAQAQPIDVMRGEEVQLLGAVAAGLAPATGRLCQPGTHCKWADVDAGVLTRFTTVMTGEFFALARNHSILADAIAGPVTAGAAFLDGVAVSADCDVLAAIFTFRAEIARGAVRPDPASRASGMVIGADVRARDVTGRTVTVVADHTLAALYALAIDYYGGTANIIPSEAAFIAGAERIWDML